MDDGVRLAATVAWPSEDGQTPLAGRFPVVLGHDSVRPQRRVRLLRRRTSSRPAAWSARSSTCAVPAGARGTSRATTSRRASSATATTWWSTSARSRTRPARSGWPAVRTSGITQYLAAEQQPPHLAAIVPAVALGDIYRDAYTHGGDPEPQLRRPVHRGPGRSRGSRDEHRPVSARGDAEREARPVAAGHGRVRLPRPSRRRPVLPRPVADLPRGPDQGADAHHRQLARRAAARSARDVPASRDAARRRDPALHGPVHPQGLRAAVRAAHRPSRPPGRSRPSRSSSSGSTCRVRTTPDRPPVEFYLQSRNQYVSAKADRWPPAGTKFKRFELDAGGLRPADDGLPARRHAGEPELRDQSGGRLQHGLRPVRDRRGDTVHPDRPAARRAPGSDVPHAGAE